MIGWLALAAGVTVLLMSGAQLRDRRDAPVNPSPSPPIPSQPHRTRFREVAPVPSKITMGAGAVGLGEVHLNFLTRALVSEQAIRDGLEAKGFIPLRVSKERPDFWPVLSDADFYVLATANQTGPVEVPSAVKRFWFVE